MPEKRVAFKEEGSLVTYFWPTPETSRTDKVDESEEESLHPNGSHGISHGSSEKLQETILSDLVVEENLREAARNCDTLNISAIANGSMDFLFFVTGRYSTLRFRASHMFLSHLSIPIGTYNGEERDAANWGRCLEVLSARAYENEREAMSALKEDEGEGPTSTESTSPASYDAEESDAPPSEASEEVPISQMP